MEKAIVMNKAWEIAREGVNKFGGKVKEYFAKALKMAWALVKKGVKKVMEFIGTEKQIKWAKDIYPNAIEKIEEVIKHEEIEEYARKKELRSEGYNQYLKFFEEMQEIKEASFWIETFGYNEDYTDFIRSFHKYVKSRKNEMEERIYNRLTNVMSKVSRKALTLSFQ